jgi:ABC-type multidrug transport system ATPase subunit
MSGLYVDSIIKTYGKRQILTDIFLTCRRGDVIGLLGRNGSGKSTLLKIIFGSLRADQKFVRLDNQMIRNLNDRKGLISYLHQENFLPGHVRVRTLLSMLSNRNVVKELAMKPSIAKMMDMKGADLSGGEKRIIEIYLTIYADVDFVLLDEPFNGVSPRHIDDIKDAIKEQSEIKGFILTDHDYRNIMDISSRIILLHDGGTKEIKDPVELQKWNYLP